MKVCTFLGDPFRIVSGVLTAVILILMGEPFPGSLGGLIVSAIPFCIGLWNGRQRAEVH